VILSECESVAVSVYRASVCVVPSEHESFGVSAFVVGKSSLRFVFQ
jgi:hypothetical protein